jgi:hypothetical protein
LKIKEPIYVLSHDSKDINKYKHLKNAEMDLEAYDIDNYSAFDSNFNKLKLYKKDKYNRVGFQLLDSKINEEEIRSYFLNDEKKAMSNKELSIKEELEQLKSFEDYGYHKVNKSAKIVVFTVCVFIIWLLFKS